MARLLLPGLLLLLTPLTLAAPTPGVVDKPHIIFILVDDRAPAAVAPPAAHAGVTWRTCWTSTLSFSCYPSLASFTPDCSPEVLLIRVNAGCGAVGYADVGFNRKPSDMTREIVSPNLNALVAEGVHLTRHYVHQFCTPCVQPARHPRRCSPHAPAPAPVPAPAHTAGSGSTGGFCSSAATG